MNILHTADWHFGKRLYKYSLAQEMTLFTNWVIEKVRLENISILMISGDIFDVTNPSNSDKQDYFSFLKAIRSLNVITVITGGNHDSVSFLNSSREYLREDGIYVLGGATDNLEDEILHFKIADEEVVICAVPFLRDRDLRNHDLDQEFNSRYEAIQYGLKVHYQNLLELTKTKYPNCPIIAMGHLFAIGSSTSDSERDIHIGNSGAVSHEIFDGYDYVALGHIHKPQIINGNKMIRYSGSPIPLSFSEKKDDKQIIIISVKDNTLETPKVIPVPKSRDLIRFSGTLAAIQDKMTQTDFSQKILPAYVELDVKEDVYSVDIIQQINCYIDQFNESNEAKIIFNKIKFKEGSKDITELYDAGTSIEELEVSDVFEKKMLSQFPEASTDKQEELKTTFNELMDIYSQE